jgi:hypothetical protein
VVGEEHAVVVVVVVVAVVNDDGVGDGDKVDDCFGVVRISSNLRISLSKERNTITKRE